MKLLALDTATENCSAALLLGGEIARREQRAPRAHAALILPMIGELLADGGVTLGSLDAIAFGCGPGAFTGVRLAASLTQGLAFGADLPVIPISDLRAVAQQALELQPAAARVLVCNDARMQEVYWGCFERRLELAAPSGVEHVSVAGQVSVPATWASHTFLGAGSGFALYPLLIALPGVGSERVHAELLPRADEVLRLALPELGAGRVLPAERALPVYLREEVARLPPESRI
ncbi:MAG: tRNA (adenosine(37)-N6)-threonylcarbamoyltransferase complex dimerization subunit type 1 TsaB [Gammaproteobacteria bacterium]|nr:tRNA (adenosine(37)-N6)-threonylcarbamoyltransferase complex dimerization subunit type 1 TsaB [Gammaproteobacteria bacterium]